MNHLTQHTVDHIVPKPQEQSFSDDAPDGLYLRVYPTGSKSYWLRYRVGGVGDLKRMKLGDARDLTLRAARTLANDALDRADAGTDPNVTARVQSPTVRDYLWDVYWHQHVTNLKDKTQAETNARLKRLFTRCPDLKSVKLDEVTRLHIMEVRAALKHAPVEANRTLALLSHALNFAELHDLRPEGSNPCRLVPRFKEEKRQPQVGREEIARILHEIRAHGTQDERGNLPALELETRHVLELMLLTGLRRSEAIGLRWNQISQDAGDNWWLVFEDSKTGAKKVPLAGRAFDLIQTWAKYSLDNARSELSPMFPVLHRFPRKLSYQWEKIRKRAGLRGLRIHDLRHAWATVASTAVGGSLPMVGAALGHASTRTTEGYVNPQANEIHELAEQTASAISDATFAYSGEVRDESD